MSEVALREAGREQRIGEPVGGGVEIGIADPAAAADDGRLVRKPRRGL